MKLFFTSLFILTFCSLKIFAQNISNEGTDFWLCFASHVPAGGSAGGLASLSVFITSKDNTSGVVTCGTSRPQSFRVIANQVIEIIVDRNASYLPGTGPYINQGIRVLIDAGQPKAVVYAHVFAGARSAATLILPVEALGQKYYAMAYSQQYNTRGSKSQFEVVCVEPNTKLNINLRINGVKQPTSSITLANVGDVYQYQNDNDISGTYIEVDASTSSCKRFAAFSGSSAVAILAPGCSPPSSNNNPALNISYDPLFQQLYPLESWGKIFPLIPFFDRNTGSIFRILASVDNTNVNVAGVSVLLNAGDFYETPQPITKVDLITSDKPVMVAEYALTEYCADSRNYGKTTIPSDPDMVILNPLEYSIKNVTMYSSTKLAITEQFLNVMIPTTGVKSFKINGVDFSARFSTVSGNLFYSYAQIDLGLIKGTNFNLTSDVGFNAMAYGFGDFESYAYSAGTNLAASIFLNAVRPGTNDIINNACLDEPFDFRLVLPYMSTKLIWTLDADTQIPQDPPKANPITINGKLLFEYRLKLNKTYKTAGTKKISITSTFPSSGGCYSGDEVLNFDFEVFENPVITALQAPDLACINNAVPYAFTAPVTGRPIQSYFWDFGDSTTSTDKNPVHIFKTIGKKIVSLYVKSDVSCISNILTRKIQILHKPLIDFSIENINCSLKDIQFKDISQLLGNKVTAYVWNFGDGDTSSSANPIHIYQKPGSYSVTLKISTAAGCDTTISKSKIIYASPVINFTDPEACVTDSVNFVATTTSTDIKTYQWDFGDNTPLSAASPNPKVSHQYALPNIYNVKLIVVSINGCVTILPKRITISGSQPKAAFKVINSDKLCSNQPVQFQDLSKVNPGNITKLEWIYDYTGSLADSVLTINNPKPQDIYTHKYPASKDDMPFRVLLRAYSGTVCSDVFGPVVILVKGSPDVSFDPIPSTCLNINPFKITQAKELSGIAGSGVFTGTGVSPDGVFNPISSGLGSFKIIYTFTATNRCIDVKEQDIIVYPVPTVDAGSDAVILLGGQTTLKAKATGVGLNYQWIPSIGLSNDKILNPIASPKLTTTYSLMVTSSDGCIETDQVDVIVAGLPIIPNTFTPNNDGVNDTWNIKYLETYVNAKITIFNRFGNPVFSSLGYDVPWDGRTNGKEVPVGVYYYIIEPKNGGKPFSGSVTVIR